MKKSQLSGIFFLLLGIYFFLPHIYVKKGCKHMTDTQINLIRNILEKSIYPVLPTQLVTIISAIPMDKLIYLTEIRLRINQPLLLVLGNTDIVLSPTGKLITEYDEAYLCTRDDL